MILSFQTFFTVPYGTDLSRFSAVQENPGLVKGRADVTLKRGRNSCRLPDVVDT